MSDLNTPSKFDLEVAISDWRRKLTDGRNGGVPDAAEMEAHLRDGMARLEAVGLSEEEAFFVSARRIGDPAALSLEFAKVDPSLQWRRQLIWIAVGYVGTMVVGAVASAIGLIATRMAFNAGASGWTMNFVEPVTYASVISAALVVLLRSGRASQEPASENRYAAGFRTLGKYIAAYPTLSVGLIAGIQFLCYMLNFSRNFGRHDFFSMDLLPFAVIYLSPTVVTLIVIRKSKAINAAMENSV